jgi:hypothetical protein
MSEKIYALLLRLFPSHFRKAYGEEALQLFRDRARNEKGFFPRLRLWFDLLADLAISVPREYCYAEPELIVVSAQRLGGTPLFYIVGDKSPHPGALFLGGTLALAAMVTFSSLLSHGGNRRALNASARQFQRAATPPASASTHPARQAAGDTNSPGGGRDETFAPTSGQSAITANPSGPAQLKPDKSQSSALLRQNPSESPQPPTRQPRDTRSSTQPMQPMQPTQPMQPMQPMQPTQDDAATAPATAVQHESLSAAERQRVIDGAIANLKQHYIYPDVAQKMADALLAHQKRGDDDAMTDGETFANRLTSQMRDVSHDMHLELVFSEDPLPLRPAEPTPEDVARYRKSMEQQNCMFERVEILPHNIGYLKLNFFPDTSVCRATATAAMASLNSADAIIFDLRDNRGGMPDMVALIAAYLFDHPEYLYNPRENTTQQSWTRSPVPGNRLADKPAYVLTSARTFSGAEQFCYDLKMLKRATLVGETTGGAAHSGVFHRIDDHFGMGIPETKPINPYSKTDWAETGVEPDVKVSAADALQTAEKLAESKLRKQ